MRNCRKFQLPAAGAVCIRCAKYYDTHCSEVIGTTINLRTEYVKCIHPQTVSGKVTLTLGVQQNKNNKKVDVANEKLNYFERR